jgi:hypothetical protein
MNLWNFENIWQENVGSYPTLRNTYNNDYFDFRDPVGGIYVNAKNVKVQNLNISGSDSVISGFMSPSIFVVNGENLSLKNIIIEKDGLIYFSNDENKKIENVSIVNLRFNESGVYVASGSFKNIDLVRSNFSNNNSWIYVSENSSLSISYDDYLFLSEGNNYFGFSGDRFSVYKDREYSPKYLSLEFFSPKFEQDGNGTRVISSLENTGYDIDPSVFPGMDVENIFISKDFVFNVKPQDIGNRIKFNTINGDIIKLGSSYTYVVEDSYGVPFFRMHFKGINFCNINEHCLPGGICGLDHRCKYG